MRRVLFPSLVATLCGLSLTARADTLFNFDFTGISGPGSTLSFTIPEPAPVQDHNVPPMLPYTSVPITVDGMGGYSGTVFLYFSEGAVDPAIFMTITPAIPDPPPYPAPGGQPSGETIVELYDLTSVLSLVSQTPAPPPDSGLIDTFQIDPGNYSLTTPYALAAPAEDVGLTVTPAASAVPEPSTLILLGPALLGVAAVAKRRRA